MITLSHFIKDWKTFVEPKMTECLTPLSRRCPARAVKSLNFKNYSSSILEAQILQRCRRYLPLYINEDAVHFLMVWKTFAVQKMSDSVTLSRNDAGKVTEF